MSERATLQTQGPASTGLLSSPALLLQRKCACGNHSTEGGECAECRKDKDPVQRKAGGHAAFRIPQSAREILGSPGQALDSGTRDRMERQFNHDFSGVRVHHDAKAAASARAIGATAYTVGAHVVFDAGRYAPSTPSGQALIAHELAHTIQQRIGPGGNHHTAEREADRAADAIRSGAPAQVSSAAAPDPLQRQAADEDKDRTAIEGVTKRTGDMRSRAWELVWRMLSRYFPEYVDKVSGVTYDEKEPSVRVRVKPLEVKGKKTQSADVAVGDRFVKDSSPDTLRARVQELGLALSTSGLKAEADSAPIGALWKIIHDKFPSKGRRVAGTSYDANLPGLRTEFDAGKVTVGRVTASWSGPMIFFGKAFLALPPADQETKVGEQLAKVDTWCVENGQLEKADLADRDIADRIRGLSAAKLGELRDKVSDPDVKHYADSLTTMSTPLELGLTRPGAGDASGTIGNVRVVVRPDAPARDVPSRSGRTDVATPGRPDPHPLTTINRGIVTRFAGFPPITITIQTFYAGDAQPDNPSRYGRGTTARDKAVGATTLRFHEGAHGLDYLQFIQAHPYPTFTGRAGMTVAQFNAAMAAYDRARNAFAADIQAFSVSHTHCVGITIDDLNRQRHIRAGRQCP